MVSRFMGRRRVGPRPTTRPFRRAIRPSARIASPLLVRSRRRSARAGHPASQDRERRGIEVTPGDRECHVLVGVRDRPDHVDAAAVGPALERKLGSFRRALEAAAQMLDDEGPPPGSAHDEACVVDRDPVGLREQRRHPGAIGLRPRELQRGRLGQLQGGREQPDLADRRLTEEQRRERDRDPDLVGAARTCRDRDRCVPYRSVTSKLPGVAPSRTLIVSAWMPVPSHRLMRRPTLGPRRSSTDCCLAESTSPPATNARLAATAQRRQRLPEDTGRTRTGISAVAGSGAGGSVAATTSRHTSCTRRRAPRRARARPRASGAR